MIPVNQDITESFLNYFTDTLCIRDIHDLSRALNRCVGGLWTGATAQLTLQRDEFAQGFVYTAKAQALQQGRMIRQPMQSDPEREEWVFPVGSGVHPDAVLSICISAEKAQTSESELAEVGSKLAGCLAKQLEQLNRAFPQHALTQLAIEVKTPLGAVLSSVQLLAEKLKRHSRKYDQEYRATLETAQRNLYRSLRMVSGITDAERIEAGLMRACPVWGKLDDIVRSVVDEVEPIAQQRRISFLLTIEEGLYLVRSDFYLVERILLSLLSNAMDSVPEETGRVEVILREKGKELILFVCDNGPGIAESARESLFEKYWVGTSHSGSKMRLGLYLASQFAGLNHSDLSLVSGEPGSTCFQLTMHAEWPDPNELALNRPSPLVRNNLIRQLVRTEFAESYFYSEF